MHPQKNPTARAVQLLNFNIQLKNNTLRDIIFCQQLFWNINQIIPSRILQLGVLLGND